MLIDEVMPQYDVRERHARWMPADPADAYAAVKEVAAEEVRLFSPLIDDFAALSEPGYAKAALNFNVVRVGAGSRVTTETRVQGTDASASRKFHLYWLVIRLGSGAIRRSWLKAVERRLMQRPLNTGRPV